MFIEISLSLPFCCSVRWIIWNHWIIELIVLSTILLWKDYHIICRSMLLQGTKCINRWVSKMWSLESCSCKSLMPFLITCAWLFLWFTLIVLFISLTSYIPTCLQSIKCSLDCWEVARLNSTIRFLFLCCWLLLVILLKQLEFA